MKRVIKWSIVWALPYTTEKIKTDYILEVPSGITPSYYLWISNGMKLPYKTQCFLNKLNRNYANTKSNIN